MSQFTPVRGVAGELVDSTVLLDSRESVRLDDRTDGVVDSVIVGDLIVAVTPRGNDGTASIFINDEKVYAAQPYNTPAQVEAFAALCEKVLEDYVGVPAEDA